MIAAVEKAGYAGATTEIPGYAEADKPYELARFEILGSTGVSGLAADLGSGCEARGSGEGRRGTGVVRRGGVTLCRRPSRSWGRGEGSGGRA